MLDSTRRRDLAGGVFPGTCHCNPRTRRCQSSPGGFGSGRRSCVLQDWVSGFLATCFTERNECEFRALGSGFRGPFRVEGLGL